MLLSKNLVVTPCPPSSTVIVTVFEATPALTVIELMSAVVSAVVDMVVGSVVALTYFIVIDFILTSFIPVYPLTRS